MKRSAPAMIGLFLISACVSAAWAREDARLKADVEALYQKADQAWQDRNLEDYMSLLTGDFQSIFAGRDREGIRSFLKDLLDAYEDLRVTNSFLSISRSGKWIKVLNDSKLEGKSRNKWSLIAQNTNADLLVQEGPGLKFARSTQIDKHRLTNINGQTYRDPQAGFSFTVPKNWEILPAPHPTVQGGVIVLAPDGSSAAMLGYVKAPGIDTKKAAEADEAIGKVLSKPGTYRLLRSGTVRINGYEGFEIESEFFFIGDRERRRHRVYLSAGDMLYVLCFDAMPARQWGSVKDGFQFILNSVR